MEAHSHALGVQQSPKYSDKTEIGNEVTYKTLSPRQGVGSHPYELVGGIPQKANASARIDEGRRKSEDMQT